ncbi:alpha/beta hydrolase [Streptomyces sp. NPDC059175]|uniref:alpha/beta hydrolase n=1 Tax=Streptomyces sp. NPDC059175 TaxID=3346757 RepID=UPI003676702E
MNRRAGVLIAVGATLTGLVSGAPPATAKSSAPRAAAPKWTSCATKAYPKLECSSVRVPLDHRQPKGKQITLALSRVRHTTKAFQGVLLVNPGGPGGSGLRLAGFVAASLPPKVAAQYDVVGFDPRGVGASKPALDCRPHHFAPVRPDSLPLDQDTERANLVRALSFSQGCAAKYGDLLPFLDTVSAAKDMDLIRSALGFKKVNYFGYSYGTYLGAVYAKLFPHRVRRAVLDSVVNPDGVWYGDNLNQDLGFDARHKAFSAWVAKHDAVYHLGTDPAKVEAAWYAMRAALRTRPAGGLVGPAELEDTYLSGGYYDGFWPELAEAFAAYATKKDTEPLVDAYEDFGAVDAAGDNGYSVYTAVQCRDASWPRDWGTWRSDNRAVYTKAPFNTWNNAWYNAPCLSWPVGSLKRTDITNRSVPPVLIFQATGDAATPYEGGVAVHRKLHGSRLVVESGGGNHGVTLSDNACLDRYLTDYLATGKLPPADPSVAADAVCSPAPEPKPLSRSARTAQAAKSTGDTLHRLLGHRN